MCTSRPQGIYRLMGGQINSASSTASRDRKVADINRLIDEWDIQGGCLQEMGINWSARDYEQNLTSWFRFDRREIRTFTSHNVHENIEQSQQGGVAQFLCKDLCAYARETEPDFRGLGRWCSWVLYAHPSHRTRIVSAYNLGKRTSNYLGTVYQQHLRFIQTRGWDISPYKLFCIDFLAAIIKWQTTGDRLLIFVDMNEHPLKGALSKMMLSTGLLEATHQHWNGCEPNTHIRGSGPIDGVYYSSSLEVTASLQLSFHEGVGDHRTVLIDVTSHSLLGTEGFRIVRPVARRLVCSNKKSVEQFIKYVEKKLQQHKLHERLSIASQRLFRDNQDAEALQMMDRIDLQMTEIFIAGEFQCRKVTRNPLPFSEPVAYWIHRKWAYQGLARVAQGRCRNIGNARRRARKAGLDNHNLTYDQCMDGVKACIAQLHQLKIHASGLRKVHLRNCLINAEDAEDIEKFKGILRVIEREEQRSMWQSIRRVTNEPRLGAITMVQREMEEGIVELTNMDEMCTEIQTVTECRFKLADSAPVMTSSLSSSVGFLGNTEFAMDLMKGTIPIPLELDVHTRIVIEEMQRMWSAKNQEHFQAFTISNEDCRHFWKRINEKWRA